MKGATTKTWWSVVLGLTMLMAVSPSMTEPPSYTTYDVNTHAADNRDENVRDVVDALRIDSSADEALIGKLTSGDYASSDWIRVFVALHVPVSQAPAHENYRDMIIEAREALFTSLPVQSYTVHQHWDYVPGVILSIPVDQLPYLASRPVVSLIGIDDEPGTSAMAEAGPYVGFDTVQNTYGINGEGATVAIIDSGIDSDHPDLADSLIGGVCYAGVCPGGFVAEDDNGHGTVVSGIITGNGTVAPVGGAPQSDIYVIKLWDDISDPPWLTSDLTSALSYIATEIAGGLSIDVINMTGTVSARHSGDCDEGWRAYVEAWTSTINYMRDNHDVLFVSVAGNNADHLAMPPPACISTVLSVAASNETDDGHAFYSNSSPTTDIFAPGHWISTTGIGGGVTHNWYGTSFAAPMVAACVANLRQVAPALNPDQIEQVLKTFTDFTVTSPVSGLTFPRLDCASAVAAFLPDSDQDGLPDPTDNCIHVANADQRDTNADGLGNACDADLDGDCSVNFGDLAALKAAFTPRPYDADADFNGDGDVNFGDLAFMKSTFFNGDNPGPGPSGLPNGCD